MSVSSQGKIEVVQFSKNVAEHFCYVFEVFVRIVWLVLVHVA